MSRAQSVDVLWAGLRNSTGGVLSGGKVYTYIAGTTTPVSLYGAQDKSIAVTNPIILDSEGKASAWGDGAYKFVITTSSGVSVRTIDGLLYGFEDSILIWGGNSSGSANAYVLTPTPAVTSFTNGQTISFIANFTNNGATTVNVSSLGAKSIKVGAGADLSGGEIVSGNVISITYNSATSCFILNTSSIFTSITVSGAVTAGSVVSSILSSSGAISVRPSLTARWNFSAGGAFVPEADSAMSIGDSTHHVFSAYIKNIQAAAGQTVGIGGNGGIDVLFLGGAVIPAIDDSIDLGSNSFSFKDIHLAGKLSKPGISYSFTGTDNTSVRSINWSALSCGTGSEGVTRATLNSALLSLGRAIATIWRDYYGAT